MTELVWLGGTRYHRHTLVSPCRIFPIKGLCLLCLNHWVSNNTTHGVYFTRLLSPWFSGKNTGTGWCFFSESSTGIKPLYAGKVDSSCRHWKAQTFFSTVFNCEQQANSSGFLETYRTSWAYQNELLAAPRIQSLWFALRRMPVSLTHIFLLLVFLTVFYWWVGASRFLPQLLNTCTWCWQVRTRIVKRCTRGRQILGTLLMQNSRLCWGSWSWLHLRIQYLLDNDASDPGSKNVTFESGGCVIKLAKIHPIEDGLLTSYIQTRHLPFTLAGIWPSPSVGWAALVMHADR